MNHTDWIGGVLVKFLMVGKTNSMVRWGGLGVAVNPPAVPGQCPGNVQNFLKKVLNIGLKKIFEKLKIDTF